jgi:hypothetical protein
VDQPAAVVIENSSFGGCACPPSIVSPPPAPPPRPSPLYQPPSPFAGFPMYQSSTQGSPWCCRPFAGRGASQPPVDPSVACALVYAPRGTRAQLAHGMERFRSAAVSCLGPYRAPQPRPRTPHPAPRTPHPAPRTPHPAPRTPHPAPRTPHHPAGNPVSPPSVVSYTHTHVCHLLALCRTRGRCACACNCSCAPPPTSHASAKASLDTHPLTHSSCLSLLNPSPHPPPQACAAGQYSLAGASVCVPCPAGRFGSSPAMGNSSCTGACVASTGNICGVGMTSFTGVAATPYYMNSK